MKLKAKHIIIPVIVTTLIYLIMKKTNTKLAKLTTLNKIRGCDAFGCGNFGANRSGHKHQGIDIVTKPNETIFSPIDGEFKRIAYPYANDTNYKGMVLVNDEIEIKIFYITPTIPAGLKVKKGQPIATSQHIAKKYGVAMVNHIHLEVRNGKELINPTNLFA